MAQTTEQQLAKQLKSLVQKVKITYNLKTVPEVGELIGYSRQHMQKHMGGKSMREVSQRKMIERLEEKLNPTRQNVSRGTSKNKSITINIEEMAEKVLQMEAMIKNINNVCAKMMAKIFSRDFLECLEEMEQNTSVILKDSKGGK